jgi:hypothetical protein
MTEPKPVSSGQFGFDFGEGEEEEGAFESRAISEPGGGPLGQISAVGFLSSTGDVSGNASLTPDGVALQFSSIGATFGTENDLPIIVIAIPVLSGATPGSSVALNIDLATASFFDANGNSYVVDVKPGRFTVGGVSINRVSAPGETVPAGATLNFFGVGLQDGARIHFENAELAYTRFVNSKRIEVITETALRFATTRIRLRNPDDSEDVFYGISQLVDSGQGQTPSIQFTFGAVTLVRQRADEVILNLSPAPTVESTIQLVAENPDVLQVPPSIRVASGIQSLSIRAFGANPGSSKLTAALGGASASLAVDVVPGTILRIPVLRDSITSLVGLAIANHSDEVAEVRIRGFSSESTSSSAPVPAGPTISMELNPHQQMAKFLVEYDDCICRIVRVVPGVRRPVLSSIGIGS